MHALEEFKASLASAMQSRGVSFHDVALYRAIVEEISAFLEHRDPAIWTVRDLEKFFSHRSKSLEPGRIPTYGAALGLITEALEELVPPTPHSFSGFERVDTSNTTNPFAETQLHLLDDEPPKPSQAPMSNHDDDFLGENQAKWTAKRAPDGAWGRTPTGAHRETPNIDILFDRADACVAITWSGFVVGTDLRRTIQQGLDKQRTHGSDRWLVDMRKARVMSQEDTDWFTDWLHNAGPAGVRRFAIVLPEHVITKMQLMRLRDATEASTAAFAMQHRVQIAFFDTVPEARSWLRKEGL